MDNAQDFEDGRLECAVEKPIKENEGTKDAYISYQVVTRVRPASAIRSSAAMLTSD